MPRGLQSAWHGGLGWWAPTGVTARRMINTSREGHPWKSLCRSAYASPRKGDPGLEINILSPLLFIFFFSFPPKAPYSSNNLERCLGMPNNKMHFRSGFIINVCIVYLSWKDYSD